MNEDNVIGAPWGHETPIRERPGNRRFAGPLDRGMMATEVN